ncbi:MAG: hypothetical protein N3A66_01385 [Planctomycetota bacterium]|nr:hypothetical protein [Planctomycetota bacterium]
MAWFDISQAAIALGVTEKALRDWIAAGKLPSRTHSGRAEVEIPDAALAGQKALAGNSLSPEQRAILALMESNRMRGTLMTQERMIENLTASLADLTARWEQGRRREIKLAALAVLLLVGGIAAALLLAAGYREEIARLQANALKEAKAGDDQARREVEKLAERLQEQNRRDQQALLERFAPAEAEEKERLAKDYAERLASQEAAARREREQLESALGKSRDEIESLQASRFKAEAEAASLRKQVEILQTRLENAEKRLKGEGEDQGQR